MKSLTIKFIPSYHVLIISGFLFLAPLIYFAFVNDGVKWNSEETAFTIIYLAITGYILKSSLQSLRKKITFIQSTQFLLLFYDGLISQHQQIIDLNSIDRIYIHKLSVNFIPTEKSIKWKSRDGNEYTLMSISGQHGYLREKDIQSIFMFIVSLNPSIRLGYIK